MTRAHQMTNYKLWTNCIYPTVLKAICLYVYGLKKYKLRAIFLLNTRCSFRYEKQWQVLCNICMQISGKSKRVNIWFNWIFVEKLIYSWSLMTFDQLQYAIFGVELINSPMQSFWQNGIALISRKFNNYEYIKNV